MNCKQVKILLVSYLNHETIPSEQALIRAHLSGCAACREEMALLSATQDQIGSALQRRAAQAVPAGDAWNRLEARLLEDAHPSASRFKAWFLRRAPGVNRTNPTQLFSGGVTMRKQFMLAAGLAALAVTLLAVSLFDSVTPVSAREILDRAEAARSAGDSAQGIRHSRVEIYENPEALPAGQGTNTILDYYYDRQTLHWRYTLMDGKTEKLLDVGSFDGSYVYSIGNGQLPTVYRDPYKPGQPAAGSDRLQEPRQIFEAMRNNPDVELVGQQTLPDGRTVYVLRARQLVNVFEQGKLQASMGAVTLTFDSHTYETLESRTSIQKGGQEVPVSSRRVLSGETLPAGSHVAWDLSDVPGIKVVDDTENLRGSRMAEVITLHELAVLTDSAYMLKSVPAGYRLSIVKFLDSKVYPSTYTVGYSSPAGDDFVIQPTRIKNPSGSAYTTASGLLVYFLPDYSSPSHPELLGQKRYILAEVETADGKPLLIISSTLPRETIQAWAEDLVLVKLK